MNNKARYTIAHCIILITLTLFVSSCGTGIQTKPETESANLEIRNADKLVKQGQYLKAAEIYWQVSQTVQSPQKEKYQLNAAELSVSAGNYDLAQQYLNLINEQNLTFDLIPRKRISESNIAIQQEQFNEVLSLLPESLMTRAPTHIAEILELRAQAFAGVGDTYSSLTTRTELARHLDEYSSSAYNQNEIWRLLALARDEELASWSSHSNQQLRGWIKLAQTKRAPYSSLEQLSYALNDWRSTHPDHPASDNLITSILESFESFFAVPERIALLLPMTGRYAKIADVIYAGILSARELRTEDQYAPHIELYDTGDNPADITYHYQRAVDDGADFVIGPLKKESVELLSQQTELPIPVLTLNYLPEQSQAPSNLFEFGLLPEDEAIQVAERASLDEHISAIIVTSNGEWGQRLADAFRIRFEELNGIVLDTQFYSSSDTDFSAPLKIALQLDHSEARHRKLKSILGQNLEFEPRRRQDVDMIFMVASPRTARLIRPQINYYYATDLPVYSTSHVFSGIENVLRDRDVNGVLYCDIPWLLKPSADHEIMRELLELEAGEAYHLLPRFAALGIDAYYLPLKLAELAALPYERYNGLTGKLRVQDGSKIFRELNWAQFVNGRPTLLPQFSNE
ncbi:MAG: penicillin-binding protein activator [Gammaproteobacteria bacterium]|nr:penicillin-binding protein activator [Gammaproteobacteria bacterium]